MPAVCESRPDEAIGRAGRDAECVRDFPGPEDLVVSHETGKNRQAGGIRRRPPFRPAVVRREIEDRARSGFPPRQRAVPPRLERLVQQPPVAIDDEQMAVAGRATAGHVTFDVVRLRPRFNRDGIARETRRAAVAFAPVRHKGQRHARLVRADHDVRDAIRGRTEIGVEGADSGSVRRRAPADPGDQLCGARIEGGAADIEVPPVRHREHARPAERLEQNGGGR